MWASMLLSPYLHPKIQSLTLEFYKSSHTNAGCALAYIPSLVGVASVWQQCMVRLRLTFTVPSDFLVLKSLELRRISVSVDDSHSVCIFTVPSDSLVLKSFEL